MVSNSTTSFWKKSTSVNSIQCFKMSKNSLMTLGVIPHETDNYEILSLIDQFLSSCFGGDTNKKYEHWNRALFLFHFHEVGWDRRLNEQRKVLLHQCQLNWGDLKNDRLSCTSIDYVRWKKLFLDIENNYFSSLNRAKIVLIPQKHGQSKSIQISDPLLRKRGMPFWLPPLFSGYLIFIRSSVWKIKCLLFKLVEKHDYLTKL